MALVVVTVPVFQRLGSEFMPPLDEGALLFMPTTLPGISVTEAQRLLQVQDRILSGFPKWSACWARPGRAETSTDPAPFSMMETVISLKPKAQWRKVATWYDNWAPEWTKASVRRTSRRTTSRPTSWSTEMNEALQHPRRLERLDHAHQEPHRHAHHRRPHARRHQDLRRRPGPDRAHRARRSSACCRRCAGTRSVFAERIGGGYFLDFD